MYILSQDRESIVRFNGDCRDTIFIDESSICYGNPFDLQIYLGEYETRDNAKVVIRLIFRAIEIGKETFEMPQVEEIERDQEESNGVW